MELYPFVFEPRFKERIWGGRKLQSLYGKLLPNGVPIGESWEITDRPGDVSVIANGPLAGKDLRWLMEAEAANLLGSARAYAGRFPLLIKLLDSQEKLSLQVHPPAEKAASLGGEPKTEMWYVAAAEPGAELYVGLKHGVTRQEFERKVQSGEVADCFHRVQVKRGDTMFLPSGRVHAIGAGLVIFEIQQNSDTTYRVFDWNRTGPDGKPRELHVAKSLASIDFQDFEPALAAGAARQVGALQVRTLVEHPLFTVSACELPGQAKQTLLPGVCLVLGVAAGRLRVASSQGEALVTPGGFCLVPAGLKNVEIRAEEPSTFLCAQPG
jgi:mannose-6-phosphate isomerase